MKALITATVTGEKYALVVWKVTHRVSRVCGVGKLCFVAASHIDGIEVKNARLVRSD